MEQPVGEDEDSELGDYIESEEDTEEAVNKKILRDDVESLLDCLTAREARVMVLRHGLCGYYPHTLKEVGQKWGLTRERIRQIEQEALAKLRAHHRAQKLVDFIR